VSGRCTKRASMGRRPILSPLAGVRVSTGRRRAMPGAGCAARAKVHTWQTFRRCLSCRNNILLPLSCQSNFSGSRFQHVYSRLYLGRWPLPGSACEQSRLLWITPSNSMNALGLILRRREHFSAAGLNSVSFGWFCEYTCIDDSGLERGINCKQTSR
jgi:hypothetical protein